MVPSHSEGRLAIVTDAGRDAVDADAPITNGAEADGEVVWSWRPDAGVKSMEATPPTTVANKPGHRGEHEISRKPLRGECRVFSGVTVVTTLVCLFYFACEAAGALSARHSLRPLVGEGKTFRVNLGRIAPRDCEAAFAV